jgi:hypothetical protein
MRRMLKLPPEPNEYIAEIQRSDGKNSKVFLSQDKRRIDSEINHQRKITLYREDLGKVYEIFPDEKAYIVFKIPREILGNLENQNLETYLLDLGIEEINGVLCSKITRIDIKTKKRIENIWIQPESGLRHKIETLNLNEGVGLSIVKKYLLVGRPDESVFEIPMGFRKIQV